MHCLKLCLQVLVNLINLVHLFIKLVLIWNHEWNQKLGGISLSLQIWQS